MERFPLEIPLSPHMRDHAFDGRNMFCAAELLHLMAAHVSFRYPALAAADQADALFSRFLLLPPEGEKVLPVFLEMETHAGEGITARMIREFQSGSGKFSRVREHASLRFLKKSATFPLLSFAAASALPGTAFEVSAERLYNDLVPFGPSYRNIRGYLRLNDQGAVVLLQAGRESFPSRLPGVPLIFDGAMQAACVWGQRYRDRVAFPVGFRRRRLWNNVQTEVPYLCRVLPVGTERKVLIFDLWIYDLEGALYETVLGLRMADVTAGRIRPPIWIREPFP